MSIVYTPVECKNLVSDDNLDFIREDIWLESIYGAHSRLENQQWLEKIVEPGSSWILEPSRLRRELFKQANIVARHK